MKGGKCEWKRKERMPACYVVVCDGVACASPSVAP